MFAFGFILLLSQKKAPYNNFLVQFSTFLTMGWGWVLKESWERNSGKTVLHLYHFIIVIYVRGISEETYFFDPRLNTLIEFYKYQYLVRKDEHFPTKTPLKMCKKETKNNPNSFKLKFGKRDRLFEDYYCWLPACKRGL